MAGEEPSSLTHLAAKWDEIVNRWLDGGEGWDDELLPWVAAHPGFKNGGIQREALPEPYLGNLGSRPAAALLSLNPGLAYMGQETWRGKLPMSDLQSRHGRFADEIRANGNSYSRWAAHWQDWETLTGGHPNPFITSRRRFVSDWLGRQVDLDELIAFELYPWHSKAWGSGIRFDYDLKHLLVEFVFTPLGYLSAPWIFAFGKSWSDLLSGIGFELRAAWGRGHEQSLRGASPTRTVEIWRNYTVNSNIVVMYHLGGAGPPKSAEVPTISQHVALEMAMDMWVSAPKARTNR